MSATVSEFHYGAVTPITAYLMTRLGSAPLAASGAREPDAFSRPQGRR